MLQQIIHDTRQSTLTYSNMLNTHYYSGSGSSVCIAADYGLGGPGIESIQWTAAEGDDIM
jgi:hypothetical protein